MEAQQDAGILGLPVEDTEAGVAASVDAGCEGGDVQDDVLSLEDLGDGLGGRTDDRGVPARVVRIGRGRQQGFSAGGGFTDPH
ncbi:hypothetical protein FE374_01670 [Georgenia yuyongxinii]|uniref:Uncharacterized protein n=1 Tax=Georgenia yuyongxinii TaxID=2589797 RepID=A0A5B8BZ10_9MICO|nr:hypothetical protein [Georgenia yuyongxinii]QDC23508.1 hypothetical protein FE374_01670 [Georgenia yuyongxinii]